MSYVEQLEHRMMRLEATLKRVRGPCVKTDPSFIPTLTFRALSDPPLTRILSISVLTCHLYKASTFHPYQRSICQKRLPLPVDAGVHPAPASTHPQLRLQSPRRPPAAAFTRWLWGRQLGQLARQIRIVGHRARRIPSEERLPLRVHSLAIRTRMIHWNKSRWSKTSQGCRRRQSTKRITTATMGRARESN